MTVSPVTLLAVDTPLSNLLMDTQVSLAGVQCGLGNPVVIIGPRHNSTYVDAV